MLAELAPQETEVLGLLALMEIQASRTAARTDREGNPVLLAAQNRLRWDQPTGSYRLQALIAACHARAARAEDTDWPRIAALYAELMRVAPSPVVELNRAGPSAWSTDPPPGWRLSRRCCRTRPCSDPTGCRRCRATCWRSWVGGTMRERRFCERPNRPATTASGRCCKRVPRG